jgi:hypothetical protein
MQIIILSSALIILANSRAKAGDHHKKTGDRVIGLQPLQLASGRYDIAEASSFIIQLLYQSVGDDRSQLNVSVNENSPVYYPVSSTEKRLHTFSHASVAIVRCTSKATSIQIRVMQIIDY